MKRIVLGTLVLSLLLGSCNEQDDFISELENCQNEVVQTKATSSIADFDPLDELVDIPLNVINKGTSKYLSAQEKGVNVKLVDSDDESGRQRWYLQSNGELLLKKGNENCNSSSNRVFLFGDHDALPTKPALHTGNRIENYGVRFKPVNEDYQMVWKYVGFMGGACIPLYLQPKSADNQELVYKEETSGIYSSWQLIPIGEYRLVQMQYEKISNAGDFVNAAPVYYDGINISDSNQVVEHTFEIATTHELTGSFSETEGVVVQNQMGWNFQVPLAHVTFGGNVSTTITSSQSTTFGSTANTTVSIKHSFKIQVPPHSPCRVEILRMLYNAKLTYVMTVEKVGGESSGKQFKLKGQWSGMLCSDLYYNVYDLSGSEVPMLSNVIPSDANVVEIPNLN